MGSLFKRKFINKREEIENSNSLFIYSKILWRTAFRWLIMHAKSFLFRFRKRYREIACAFHLGLVNLPRSWNNQINIASFCLNTLYETSFKRMNVSERFVRSFVLQVLVEKNIEWWIKWFWQWVNWLVRFGKFFLVCLEYIITFQEKNESDLWKCFSELGMLLTYRIKRIIDSLEETMIWSEALNVLSGERQILVERDLPSTIYLVFISTYLFSENNLKSVIRLNTWACMYLGHFDQLLPQTSAILELLTRSQCQTKRVSIRRLSRRERYRASRNFSVYLHLVLAFENSINDGKINFHSNFF